MRKNTTVFAFLCVLACLRICDADGNHQQHHQRREVKDTSAYCYDDDDRPYVRFGTKTAYRFNRNKEDDEIQHPGCTARQFWLLARHGTRNPGSDEMAEMAFRLPSMRDAVLENHERGRGLLCKDDLSNLKKWRFRGDVTADKVLVDEGFDELEDLGDRFQDRFEGLLTKPFTNKSYIFRHTKSERTESSARAFAKGVFGKRDQIWMPPALDPDPLLRFYKTCRRWKVEVDDNPEAIREKTLFEASHEMDRVLQSVSERLGFSQGLSLAEVDMMYLMCSFDKAWRPKKLSPWCAAFSRHDLEVLEYREDLEYFYEDGYGNEINYVQACPVVKDIVDHFSRAVKMEPQAPKGIFYFSHSGTLLKVLARLGLFRDEVSPTHANRAASADRQWRTSLIDSFATNLALALFTCDDGVHRVTAYVQERPVHLPGCPNHLCPFDDFMAAYGAVATDCDIDHICGL